MESLKETWRMRRSWPIKEAGNNYPRQRASREGDRRVSEVGRGQGQRASCWCSIACFSLALWGRATSRSRWKPQKMVLLPNISLPWDSSCDLRSELPLPLQPPPSSPPSPPSGADGTVKELVVAVPKKFLVWAWRCCVTRRLLWQVLLGDWVWRNILIHH